MLALCADCIMYGAKCFTEAEMAKASISHWSQSFWFTHSSALKSPAGSDLLLRVA